MAHLNIDKFLCDKAEKAISTGLKLSKNKKTKTKGGELIALGQTVLKMYRSNSPDFEERAKGLFLHFNF